MPIFISYSHKNKNFVDQLAAHLIKNKAQVWIDRWELRVGDSIISKVQDAIHSASALLVVLSKDSVASEWCKKELNFGLWRELEEKRVVVLPVVVEDCEIPPFLRDKLYADFRTSFDEGLNLILDSIASVTSTVRSRIETAEYNTDWAIDWGYEESQFVLNITMVKLAKEFPFTVLNEIKIVANNPATERYNFLAQNGLDWFGRNAILHCVVEFAKQNDIRILLEDQFPQTRRILMQDKSSEKEYRVYIKSRWLGQDTGGDLLVDISSELLQVEEYTKNSSRKLTNKEMVLIFN